MARLDEAKRIGAALLAAHNDINGPRVDAALASGDAYAKDLEPAERIAFWVEVEDAFNDGPRLIQKMENSRLHDLIKAIEEALKARQAGK